jgi:hypothetical protein
MVQMAFVTLYTPRHMRLLGQPQQAKSRAQIGQVLECYTHGTDVK